MKNRILNPLQRLTISRPNATVLLFLAALAAVLLANTPWNDRYYSLLNHSVSFGIGEFSLFSHGGEPMTLSEFVNDALMALFFFVVGLEIKQEILVGELSTPSKAILPIVGALGGMIVPVLFYLLVCHQGDAVRGAAIPMATDIAFALAVLSVLGSRVPTSLKAFLTALAVVDDIGGIIIIAAFYSAHINLYVLAVAVIICGLLYFLGRRGISSRFFYYIGGVIVWLLFLESGIHATISGVIVAMCVPCHTRVNLKDLNREIGVLFNLLPEGDERIKRDVTVLSHTQISVLSSIRRKAGDAISPVQKIESELTPFVNYLVLPLFAFVNAGVTLGGVTAAGLMGVPLAILLGLFMGKALGIFSFTYLFIRSGLGRRPKGMTWANLFPLSILGGIGFTVSLFLAGLSFGEAHPVLFNEAKLGILCGSIISGIAGYLYLGRVLKRESKAGII